MELKGQQRQKFMDVLLAAFPTRNKLATMLSVRLEKNLDAIAMGDDLTDIVFRLLQTAEAQGWTFRLLNAARESCPDNSNLLAFAQQYGLAPINTPPRTDLERIIRQTNSFLDLSAWRSRLGMIEGQVCRVETPSEYGTEYGTGFLLGPDVLITNYHVLASVIQGRFKSSQVALRFDYKRLADGVTLNEGTVYRLAEDWLIDSNPPGTNAIPALDELDYAILRVQDGPGSAKIGNKNDVDAPDRGWIDIPKVQHTFQPNTPLFIVQHPKAEPIKLALDTDAIIEVNANGTRVMYRTNTEPGSSGSPCFNSNWDLVALHRGGIEGQHNEGVPLTAILALLEERGLRHVLGKQEL